MPSALPSGLAEFPIPVLPARPSWFRAYARAARFLAQRGQGYVDAARLVRESPDACAAYRRVKALRAADRHARADRLVASYMRRAATGHGRDPLRQMELILLFVEEVVGVETRQRPARATWRLREEPPVGVRGLPLGDGAVDLLAEAESGGGIVVWAEATHPFFLEIETPFTTFAEQVPAGRTRYLLTYLDRTDVRED